MPRFSRSSSSRHSMVSFFARQSLAITGARYNQALVITSFLLRTGRCVAQVVDLRLQPDDLHLMPGEVLRLRADTPRPRRQGNPTETFAIRTKRTVQPRHGLRWRRRSSSGGPARPAVRGCAPRPKLSSSLIPCRGPREESAHTRGPCPPRTPHYG